MIIFITLQIIIIDNAGLFPTDTEVCELIDFLDGNNQGKVQLEELSMAMMHQVINVNVDGYFLSELTRIFKFKSNEECRNDFLCAFKAFDLDGK